MKLLAAHARLPEGWARDVLIDIDGDGNIASVMRNTRRDGAERIEGFVLPGMPNVHSHAFQRAMAGLAEARTHPVDGFWTWRELMYRLAARVTSEQMHDIAAYLYVEMLKAGYTSVAEFHYLHHAVGGRPHERFAETSEFVLAAARKAGIWITLLPVLYRFGGFGSAPPMPEQARFVSDVSTFVDMVSDLQAYHAPDEDARIGLAFHSLRAVDEPSMRQVLADLDAAPIHIHIAEQQKEVADCVAWSGMRPVQWLFHHAPVDERWCLVHATHLSDAELRTLAASRAVAGLCPTTEANLGDGLFPAASFVAHGGRFGIGSDSHVSVSVAEELRLIEYGERLTAQRRAAFATEASPSPAERLYLDAATHGAQALGIAAGRIEAGARADLVVLDPESRAMWNVPPERAFDAWVFAGGNDCVRDVMVGGSWKIRGRRHAREDELATRFRRAQAALLA
jgi:formimidoylglutamate deiminase